MTSVTTDERRTRAARKLEMEKDRWKAICASWSDVFYSVAGKGLYGSVPALEVCKLQVVKSGSSEVAVEEFAEFARKEGSKVRQLLNVQQHEGTSKATGLGRSVGVGVLLLEQTTTPDNGKAMNDIVPDNN